MPAPIFTELRERRKALGLRQIDVAELAGYTEWQIGRWESGKVIPRGENLLNWCEALGVELKLAPTSR